MTAQGSYPHLTAAQHLDFAIKAQRADYLAQSPAVQRETIGRVRRLLEAERARNQRQPSYLMVHAKDIYGRDL